MTWLPLAEAPDSPDGSLSAIGLNLLFFSPAVALCLFALFALWRRWIVMGWAYREQSELAAANWVLYEKSQETLAEVRQALFVANSRADTANDTALISARLLQALQSGGIHAPEA